jgi:hypothetical protein
MQPVSTGPTQPSNPEAANWMKGTRQAPDAQPQAKPEAPPRQAAAKPAQKADVPPSRTAEVIDSAHASRGERHPSEQTPPLLLTKKVVEKRKRKKGAEDEIYTLKGTSPIVEAPSIGPKMARRFQGMGVRTVSDLLALSPATAAVLLDVRNVSAPDIADWQVQAMLACTVPDLIHREAQVVVGCGVRSVEELAQSDAKELADAMREWAKGPDGASAWGRGAAPAVSDAESLIERAQAVVSKRPKSAA